MKTLKIKGDYSTPEVMFDYKKGKLFMGGTSLPENVLEVYAPIINWLEEYKNCNDSTVIEFNFDYLNTASTNMIARIIESIQDMVPSKTSLSVKWYYSFGDYDMKELAEELLEETEINYTIEAVKE